MGKRPMLEIITFITGLALLVYGSEKAIDSAKDIGAALRISPLIMGIVLLSVGTSLPEISTSIASSIINHGDLTVGDVIGSNLVEITFVLGIVAIICPFKAKRRDILLIGGGSIVASIIAVVLAGDGYVSRVDALLLLLSFAVIVYVLYFHLFRKKPFKQKKVKKDGISITTYEFLFVAFICIVFGTNMMVSSAIDMARTFGISEYIIGMFGIGPGGSLPELVVTITALRRREVGLAIGNILGTNIADSTISLGAGPLLSPNVVSGSLVWATGLYMIAASVIVVGMLAARGKFDRKAGIVAIALYILSFFIFGVIGV